MIITADHGNCEEMINNETGAIDTEHNKNPVPFVVISQKLAGKSVTLTAGILADIAPTVLKLMNIEVPSSMSGHNLLDSKFD